MDAQPLRNESRRVFSKDFPFAVLKTLYVPPSSKKSSQIKGVKIQGVPGEHLYLLQSY